MDATDTVYANPMFKELDIGSVMRVGHPDIAEGDQHIRQVVRTVRSQLGRPLRILDVGAGSGDLTVLLAEEFPDCRVIANEIEPVLVGQAEAKIAGLGNAEVFSRPFEEWQDEIDVMISWGTHHHLRHDYLDRVRRILVGDGVLVIGDEFCPEYLTARDQDRLSRAEHIELVDGHLFDNREDIERYRADGTVPEWSRQVEQARRKTLWRWYRFVCDYAVARDCWPVAVAELEIARGDLITSFEEEHKTSPFLLERELALEGFETTSKTIIGNRAPHLQSFVIYTCRTGDSSLIRVSGARTQESLAAGERSRTIPVSSLHAIHRLVEERASGATPLHVGEPHIPMPKAARRAYAEAVMNGHTRYGDASGLPQLCEELAAVLAARSQTPARPERVFVSPGSCEAIIATLQSVAVDGGVVLLPRVHWPIHLQQVYLSGMRPRFYATFGERGADIVEELERCHDDRVRVVVVNSPANPSGQVLSPHEIQGIHEWARRRGVWILSDEAYEDFVFVGSAQSPARFDAALAEDERIVFSVHTFSKGYSFTGCRLGYVAAPTRERAELLRRVQEATLVSPATPVQQAGLAALRDRAHLIRHHAYVRQTRDEVVSLLDTTGLLWRVPDGGWYALLDLSGRTEDTDLFCRRLLADEGVALAPGAGFLPDGDPTGRRLARVTLCAKRSATLQALHKLLACLDQDGGTQPSRERSPRHTGTGA